MFDIEITDNHIHKLSKSIINKYLKVRFYPKAKSFKTQIWGKNIKNKLKKTILFKDQ